MSVFFVLFVGLSGQPDVVRLDFLLKLFLQRKLAKEILKLEFKSF